MSSHTKGMRNADIRARANGYQIPIKLSDGEIDQCADMGKYEVFEMIFPEYHRYFRVTSGTFAHGDAWPTLFFGLAGRQYIPGSPNTRIRFADTTMIPMLTRNDRLKGTTLQPVLYTADRKFYFIPSSITGAVIERFEYPRVLADPAIDDDQTDTMPEFSESLITSAGFEYMLKMLLDNQQMFELTKEEIGRVEALLKNVFEEKYAMLNSQAGEAD